MKFRNPLTGKYVVVNAAFLRERALRSSDHRSEFYRAILSSEFFEQYYQKVGELLVQPDTTSYQVNADMEIKYALRNGWLMRIALDDDEPSSEPSIPDVELLERAAEGRSYLAQHFRRERNRGLVAAKKKTTMQSEGTLRCEACGFDFYVKYGKYGVDFCEVHHRKPLSSAKGSVTTSLDELAILCANCHRIIHRSDPMLSVSELSDVIVKCKAELNGHD